MINYPGGRSCKKELHMEEVTGIQNTGGIIHPSDLKWIVTWFFCLAEVIPHACFRAERPRTCLFNLRKQDLQIFHA